MTAPLNRAQRRRQAARLRRHLRKMSRAAAGLWQVVVIRSGMPPHPDAKIAMAAYVRGLGEARRHCLLCQHEFLPHALPSVAVLVGPGEEDALRLLGSVVRVCREHASQPDAVLAEAALASIGRGLGLSVRLVPRHAVHPEGGRA